MESIEQQALKRIIKCGRGKVFTVSDFAHLADPKTVGKAFERMTDSGKIIRVARGVYCYPKIDKLLGMGILYPSANDVAQAVAKSARTRIVPTGIQALNDLGLSTQIPMNPIYLTDGSRRTIRLERGGTIRFKQVAPGTLAFSNKLAMLITLALREIGKYGVTPEQMELIKLLLQKEPKQKIMADASLMPQWIRQFIDKCYD
ncbi:MAG: DUF6088 family protein [Bacteroidales bacterium]|nr:DUF6088 family protein [Bacteroidales bacterium]MCD8394601.1 DUF6088 family protein [Bacteroidales bacterium]